MELGIIGVFLLWNSIVDIRKQKVSILSIAVCGGLWVVMKLCGYDFYGVQETVEFWKSLLWGILPGLMLCVVTRVSRGAIGTGDGVLILLLGLYLGIQKTMTTLAAAFFLAFFWAIGLLCFKKRKKDETFPFVPFITLGFLFALYF